jgi:hypothetical protein
MPISRPRGNFAEFAASTAEHTVAGGVRAGIETFSRQP